jgi:hypothetical protein
MTFISNLKKLLKVLFLSPILLIHSCNIEPLPEISKEQNQENKLENPSKILQVDEFRFFDKILKTPKGLFRWEAQLNKLIENNSFYIGNNLELLDYKFMNVVASIGDLEIIKYELANKFTSIPVKKNNKAQEYELNNNVFLKKEYDQFLNMIIPTSEAMLRLVPEKKHDSFKADQFYIFKSDDLSTVELKWKYNGEILKTLCLISKEKGVIYDPFLYFIGYSQRGNTSQYAKISSSSLRLTSFFPEGGGSGSPISYKITYHDDSYSIWGLLQWTYDIEYEAKGEEVNGTNSITDKYLAAFHDAGIMFSCDAKCTSLSFKTGTDGHLDVAYGYTYQAGDGASLTFNGFGFTISGGGAGATANDYIGADELY